MSVPELVEGEQNQGLILTPVKKLIIRALRATFTSSYPNARIPKDNIDLEYPIKAEQYPGIWVRFSPSKIQSSGINPYQFSNSELYAVWNYEGSVSFTVVALTSKERDLISDGIIEAFAFARMMPAAGPFYDTIHSSDLVNLAIDQDELFCGGQTETVGTPWDDDRVAYEDRYSFNVIGQVRSRVNPDVEFRTVAEVQTYATLTNAPGAADNSIGDDGDGAWQ